ncbi:odorant receptor 83a isoform X2 [Tribolium castaneum]|uniref:Odorant receptor n=1 Tax=Tribolium castaneum TaxID=7070 RepID=C0Z3R5_TRICA|nr:PREDICTED: odorant receptor 83a [Tribolium castaneum]CAM84016.1 olfactory receptor 18 [Tribolium castaneum]|eukprot:XP_967759.1 PREDICTED: odorant receptor 83a [Tribolium castaneum]
MAKLEYLTGATFTLKCAVLYPIDSNNPKIKKILYAVWAIFFILTFVTGFIQCFVFVCINPFDLVQEAMIIMSLVFYKNWQNMVALVTNINKNFHRATDNVIEKISMDQASELSDKLAYVWTSSLAVGSVVPVVLAIATGNLEMPMPAWFPYDYNKSPVFEITYLWQVFCLITLAIIYGASDMFFPCITIIIGQQFKILASNFKNNFYTSLIKLGAEESIVQNFSKDIKTHEFRSFYIKYGNIFKILNNAKFQTLNRAFLKRNIKHHKLLLRFCEDLNKILNTFLLIRVSAIVFNLIFIGFNIIISTDRTLMLGFCNYFCFGSTELFIHTYSGQILTENADFLWTLYECPWYLCDVTYQKMLILVQMRVKRMVSTKAGNFFTMIAPSFIAFQRAVFSYITLLKEVTDLGKD